MTIDITTPALLFPAISLLLMAYTNRFLALARVIRELSAKLSDNDDSERVKRQIYNLRLRINLIKTMQALGILSILLCVVSMSLFFFNLIQTGRFFFGASLLLMVGSLLVSLWEIMLSGNALKIELEKML